MMGIDMTNCDFEAMYLDWVNNHISIKRFAEHYSITVRRAKSIIRIGRHIHANSSIV